MITKEEILAELENTTEPEKKLHEIAERTGQPVMVIRKILKDLVTVVPPEKEYDNVNRIARLHYEVSSHQWLPDEIAYAEECWRCGATIDEIASAVGRSKAAIKGMIQRNRERFPPRTLAFRVWSSEEILRAAEMWRNPDMLVAEICECLGRNDSDFYQLRVENPVLFPPRKTWRRREP